MKEYFHKHKKFDMIEKVVVRVAEKSENLEISKTSTKSKLFLHFFTVVKSPRPVNQDFLCFGTCANNAIKRLQLKNSSFWYKILVVVSPKKLTFSQIIELGCIVWVLNTLILTFVFTEISNVHEKTHLIRIK